MCDENFKRLFKLTEKELKCKRKVQSEVGHEISSDSIRAPFDQWWG